MSFFQLAGVSAVTSWQRTPPPFSYTNDPYDVGRQSTISREQIKLNERTTPYSRDYRSFSISLVSIELVSTIEPKNGD